MQQNLFDLTQEYDQMLGQGLRLSGENKQFFIAGRLHDLRRHLPAGFTPRRLLDFGCGIGDSTPFFLQAFPGIEICGVDTATSALSYARQTYGSSRIRFVAMEDLGAEPHFDLCYVNGVFHHIQPEQRVDALHSIRNALNPQGYLALFENNPWNPGTRMVMSRIPFDKDAQPFSPPQAKALLLRAGFSRVVLIRSLFYFPRWLAPLRSIERWLAPLPLGAQYYVLAAP